MQDTIVIGEVLKPQGIRGELKVRPLLDDAADIKKFRRVFIEGREYKVLSARTDAQAAYLALSGIADRNAAEAYRGKQLEALRSEAPAPAEGRYYIVDLIGSTAVTGSGERIGEIVDVLPAHTDVFVLRNGDKESMVPAADGVIVRFDAEKKILTLDAARLKQVLVEQ